MEMTNDALKFGLVNQVFTPEAVMDLLYGELTFTYRTVTTTNQDETFCQWQRNPLCFKDWDYIPLKQRKDIITLILERIKRNYSDFDCFHIRILCLLHHLLDDEENKVECIDVSLWGKQRITTLPRYKFFLSSGQVKTAAFEMFLWYKLGLHKTKEERKLLRQVWNKILGRDNIKFSKLLKELVEKKVAELKKEYQQQDRAQQEKCMLAFNFLNGYLDFLKISR